MGLTYFTFYRVFSRVVDYPAWLDYRNDSRLHPRGDRWTAEYVHKCLSAHPGPAITDYTSVLPASRYHHRDSGAHRYWLGLVRTRLSISNAQPARKRLRLGFLGQW